MFSETFLQDNTKAFASEFYENLEEMSPGYHIDIYKDKYLNTI